MYEYCYIYLFFLTSFIFNHTYVLFIQDISNAEKQYVSNRLDKTQYILRNFILRQNLKDFDINNHFDLPTTKFQKRNDVTHRNRRKLNSSRWLERTGPDTSFEIAADSNMPIQSANNDSSVTKSMESSTELQLAVGIQINFCRSRYD